MASERPIVSVVTANSNSGSGMVKDLLGKHRGKAIVRAVFRGADKAAAFTAEYGEGDDIQVVHGIDAGVPTSLPPAFDGATVAFIVTTHDPAAGYDKDAGLTINLVNAAVTAGVKHIIYLGSWTVHQPDRLSSLAARFLPVEARLAEVRASGVGVTYLHGGYFMQNFLAAIAPSVAASGRFFLPDPIRLPANDARDHGRVAAAIVAGGTAAHDGKVYEMSGPDMLSGASIAATLTRVLGRDVAHVAVDVETAVAKLPPGIAQLVRYLADAGEAAVPTSTDIVDLAGGVTSFDAFAAEHRAAFEPAAGGGK